MVIRCDDLAAVEDCLFNSFQAHDGIAADELFSAFKSQISITLHFLRDTDQLMIRAPHSLIDRRGTLYLYHILFTALSRQSVDYSNGNLKRRPPNLT